MKRNGSRISSNNKVVLQSDARTSPSKIAAYTHQMSRLFVVKCLKTARQSSSISKRLGASRISKERRKDSFKRWVPNNEDLKYEIGSQSSIRIFIQYLPKYAITEARIMSSVFSKFLQSVSVG